MRHREQYYEQHTNRVAGSHANMESHPRHASVGKEETPRLNGRVNLTVISYIHRDRDPDGTAIKYLIDSLVSNSILADDTAKEIGEITQKQVKVKNKSEEKTEVILTQDAPIPAPDPQGAKLSVKRARCTDNPRCTNCRFKGYESVCKQCPYREES